MLRWTQAALGASLLALLVGAPAAAGTVRAGLHDAGVQEARVACDGGGRCFETGDPAFDDDDDRRPPPPHHRRFDPDDDDRPPPPHHRGYDPDDDDRPPPPYRRYHRDDDD